MLVLYRAKLGRAEGPPAKQGSKGNTCVKKKTSNLATEKKSSLHTFKEIFVPHELDEGR